ncbi:hypothetical protein EON65_35840 [archaeon]|nr:MAG: hypothetical protein EON65_35840 [archaeon]
MAITHNLRSNSSQVSANAKGEDLGDYLFITYHNKKDYIAGPKAGEEFYRLVNASLWLSLKRQIRGLPVSLLASPPQCRRVSQQSDRLQAKNSEAEIVLRQMRSGDQIPI